MIYILAYVATGLLMTLFLEGRLLFLGRSFLATAFLAAAFLAAAFLAAAFLDVTFLGATFLADLGEADAMGFTVFVSCMPPRLARFAAALLEKA
jgi:hypothetical protein